MRELGQVFFYHLRHRIECIFAPDLRLKKSLLHKVKVWEDKCAYNITGLKAVSLLLACTYKIEKKARALRVPFLLVWIEFFDITSPLATRGFLGDVNGCEVEDNLEQFEAIVKNYFQQQGPVNSVQKKVFHEIRRQQKEQEHQKRRRKSSLYHYLCQDKRWPRDDAWAFTDTIRTHEVTVGSTIYRHLNRLYSQLRQYLSIELSCSLMVLLIKHNLGDKAHIFQIFSDCKNGVRTGEASRNEATKLATCMQALSINMIHIPAGQDQQLLSSIYEELMR